MASFAELGLAPELLKAVSEEGYSEPTPIQAQAIPVLLEGRDVLGAAQTGTGKTAGFALPILQRLQPLASTSPSPARHPIRALILTPTRELALQVFESFQAYGRHVALRPTVIYGGVNMDPQIQELRAGREIVVATPGRLLDHVGQKTINLSQVEIFVLDEADRMLDMGFIRDIRRIMDLLPKVRQNLLFSATFSKEITDLADQLLKAPVKIEVARRNAPADLVRQQVYLVDQDAKRALLAKIIKDEGLSQVLVFMRTKHGANRLTNQLVRDGINAAAIHSNKTQSARERALEEFKEGKVAVLVATDIAARGLDIEELPHVINYDIPHVPEDYVHRIGRTGRAGNWGDAISLVSPEEMRLLKEIEKLLKREIPRALSPVPATSREPEFAPRGPPRRRDDAGRREQRASRPPRRDTPPRPPSQPKHHDPIFTQPYDAQEVPASPTPADPAATPRRGARPVPVLFGKRTTS